MRARDGSRLSGRIQDHVGDNCQAHASTLVIREVHLPHADSGSNAHEARPRQQPSFRDRTEVVDLKLDGGETARTGETVMERGADGRIRDTRRDASMQRTGAIQQFGTHAALDGEAIAVRAHQLKSQQVIERVTGEEISNVLGFAFGGAQVFVILAFSRMFEDDDVQSSSQR
jgi:hypothetical protein